MRGLEQTQAINRGQTDSRLRESNGKRVTGDPWVVVDENLAHVSVITLNRPEKSNALTIEFLEELCAALDRARTSKRVIILKGNGPDFCSGLDLWEVFDEENAALALELMASSIYKIMSSPLVTIAVVQGAALAGGAGLMLACDLSVVADDARIGVPEVRRGLVPTMVMTFLRRKIGEQKAREMILIGDPISGQEAFAVGMVTRVTSKDQIFAVGKQLADAVLRNAPIAILRSKRLLDELWDRPIAMHLECSAEIHRRVRTSREAKEGFRAFREKRDPSWDHHTLKDDIH